MSLRSSIVSEKVVAKVKLNKLDRLWEKIQNSQYWVSFPTYLLYWLSTYDDDDSQDKYRYLAPKLTIHELRLPKTETSIDTKIVEGECDIRRFLWVEEDSVLSFGLMCDEYASEKMSYLAFLEKSEYGSISLLKPILCAYAEFVSLISPGWVLHIWADAIDNDESFLFRNARHPPTSTASNKNRSKDLKKIYAALLQQSGFKGTPYSIDPIVPPLPEFGKKGEAQVRKKYEQMKKNISKEARNLNQYFSNTLCTKLELKLMIPPMRCYNGKKNNVPSTLIDNKFFSENKNLDFSTRRKAIKSTKILIQMLNKFEPAYYYKATLGGFNSKVEMQEFYKNVLKFVKYVQRAPLKKLNQNASRGGS